MDEARFREAEQRVWSSRGVRPHERWGALPTGERVRAQFVGAGPPVLFIHGATVSGTSWADLVVRLPGHQCILVDRPGCGLSDPYVAPSTDTDDVAARADRLVPDVLDTFELDRAHVAATSYGGYFALRGAAAHPDRVDRIVEFSWLVGAPLASVPFVLRLVGIPGLGRLTTKVKPTRGMARRTLRQMGLAGAIDSGKFTDEMLDWFVSVIRDTDSMANEMRSSPRLVRPIAGFDTDVMLGDDLLAGVRAPTLFVWGDDDPNGGGEIASDFSRRLPDAELHVLTGAGHAPWIDEPDRCVELMVEFLGRS
jgi:2-hydroxy-6-oxonona-2,4-dienedioate hydrolase